MPLEKARPSPITTRQRRLASSPSDSPSLASSSHISIVMALSRSGRLSRSQPTAPTCS